MEEKLNKSPDSTENRVVINASDLIKDYEIGEFIVRAVDKVIFFTFFNFVKIV